jgi:hypothetical protein
MVVADKFATNASNGGGGEFLMPSYVFSPLFPFWKIVGSPQFPASVAQPGVQKFGVNKNLPV